MQQEAREKARAEQSAIKGDYKKWQGSISYNDLVEFQKRCYNDYMAVSQDMNLPTHVRLSYLDQATSFKKSLDYIERQTS